MKITKSKLRMLIKESILLERKSDSAYFSFIDFFFNSLLRAENFDIKFAPINGKEWETSFWQKYNPNSGNKKSIEENKNFIGIGLVLKRSAISNLWSNYQAILPPANDIFFSGDIKQFQKWMGMFSIGFLKVHPAGGIGLASMASDGRLFIYKLDSFIRHKDLPYALEGRPADLQRVVSMIFSLLSTNSPMRSMYALRQLIEHELTHFLNTIRADGKRYRAKGGKEQFRSGSAAYMDSTEEMQARLITAYQLFQRVSERYGSHLYELKLKIYEGINKGFLKGSAILFINKFTSGPYQKYSKRNQKRIVKRVIQFFENEVIPSADYKQWQMSQIPEV